MCGRISISLNKDDFIQILKNRYNINNYNLEFDLPHYNIAPSQKVISVIYDGKKFRIGLLKWGFIPSWASDDKFYVINIKAETISTKPMFKKAFNTQRCVILADGYYEWDKDTKTPYRFTLNNQKLFPLAGLWSTFIKNNKKIHTCAIITTRPNKLTKQIHKRMPVILTKEKEVIWLNPKETNQELLQSLLVPYSSNNMNYYKVSSIVNNPRNNNIKCIIPI